MSQLSSEKILIPLHFPELQTAGSNSKELQDYLAVIGSTEYLGF